MPVHPYAASVPSWLSAGRFGPYLRAADGDVSTACELYAWSAALSAAAFEAIGYVEIIVRNAIDHQLRQWAEEERRGMPWFFLPVTTDTKVQGRIERDIADVQVRLRNTDRRKETRDQVVAGLSFGFWTHMLGKTHEQLWRTDIHHAFPGSSGKRSDIATAMTGLNRFRNRLAHHDSLLAVDVHFELTRMLLMLAWVDPASADWLRSVERVTATLAARPTSRPNTVVVAAADAWPLYQSVHAYICQPGRTFQPVEYMAFYADKQVQLEVPHVLERLDNVDWTDGEVHRLRTSGTARDLRVADIIEISRVEGWSGGRYQVFLLSKPGEAKHITLRRPVTHNKTGRGSAYTQGQRYVFSSALSTAVTTDDLMSE